jgi:SWI/SNF chromatin-remodeling complex subunit SWI1
MTGSPRTRQELSRRKIEYKPLARDVDSYGGRDLKAIETELHNSAKRPLRELNEWGTIDIDALTMSIRSKLSTELSYALTTLTLLSTMKGQQPSSGFPINNCPDLLGEILDLVEDVAFGDVEDVHETINLQDDPHIVTNRELVDIVYESGMQLFAGLEQRQGSKRVDIGPRQRPANLILTVTNIIRNLSVFTDNVPFLAGQPRLLDLLLRICGISEKGSAFNPTSTVLSITDLLAVRKDVLYILCQLAPAIHFSEGITSLSVIRRIFYLVASYLVDPAEAVSPVACVQLVGVPLGGNLKPPSLADISLEVFTRVCQAEGSRLFFSKAVSRPSLWRLFVALVHRLPIVDVDFQLTLRGEPWMSYVEKLVLALYSLGFIFPPELKAKVKKDRRLGFKSVMIRIIQKMFVHVNPDARHFNVILVRRIIETLKLIDDEEDSFDNTKGVVSTLSFGMGYGEVNENDVERGTGLLGGYKDIGWDILLCREVSHDDVMFSELESLIRIEF